MPEVDRAVRVLEDGRFFSVTYRVPGRWLLQGFVSEESEQAGEPALMACADEVPDGRDYLTDQEAQALLDEWVPRFLESWTTMCQTLGVPEGATRR
jgi:hypothetical protein